MWRRGREGGREAAVGKTAGEEEERRRSSKVTDFSVVDRSDSWESDVHFVVIRYDKVEDDDSFEGQDTFEAKNSTMTANEVRSADWLRSHLATEVSFVSAAAHTILQSSSPMRPRRFSIGARESTTPRMIDLPE